MNLRPLLAFLLFCLAPLGAFAADDGPIYETVVVGRSPHEEGLARERIDRRRIAESGSTTAAEVLEREPAVSGQTTGKGERQIRLRGFDQRGVAIYLDGVPFTMPWDGSVDLGKLPAEMIDSVLLLKGPTSIVYGPGGMGGAVLIETRDPGEGPLLESEFETGGLDRGRSSDERLSLYHGNQVGPFGYAIGLGHAARGDYLLSGQYEPRRNMEGVALRNAHGTLDNSDRNIQHGALKLKLDLPEKNALAAQLIVLDGDFGIPRSETDDRPYFRRFTVWRGILTQVAHSYRRKGLTLEEAFYGGWYDNRLDSYDDATYSTQDDANASTSWYHDQVYGGRIRAQYAFRDLKPGDLYLRLWVSAEHDIHDNQYLLGGDDNALHRFRRTLVQAVPEIDFPIVHRLRGLVSFETDADIPDVADQELDRLAPGESIHVQPRWALQPMASLRYDPTDTVMLRLTGARRERIPSLSERFSSQIGFTKASPGLKPENAWYSGIELDWKAHRTLGLSFAGFDAEVSDLINSEYIPETNGLQQKQNVGRARLAGAEASITYTPIPVLAFNAGYAYLYARRLNRDPDEEDRIKQIPAHQAIFGLESRPAPWVTVATSFRIVGSQAFDDYTILGLGELGPYYVWDAYLAFRALPSLTVYLKGTNLLDMNYQTRYGYPDRGACLWLGVRITFEHKKES